jgi:hypothetical protein
MRSLLLIAVLALCAGCAADGHSDGDSTHGRRDSATDSEKGVVRSVIGGPEGAR